MQQSGSHTAVEVGSFSVLTRRKKGGRDASQGIFVKNLPFPPAGAEGQLYSVLDVKSSSLKFS